MPATAHVTLRSIAAWHCQGGRAKAVRHLSGTAHEAAGEPPLTNAALHRQVVQPGPPVYDGHDFEMDGQQDGSEQGRPRLPVAEGGSRVPVCIDGLARYDGHHKDNNCLQGKRYRVTDWQRCKGQGRLPCTGQCLCCRLMSLVPQALLRNTVQRKLTGFHLPHHHRAEHWSGRAARSPGMLHSATSPPSHEG